MKTIAICNHKGGVGKTALSMAIAEGLHRKGKRTLLVDLDQQMNATQQAKIDTTDEVTVYDLLTSFDYTAKDGIKHFDGGDIIPGDVLVSNAESDMAKLDTRLTMLVVYLMDAMFSICLGVLRAVFVMPMWRKLEISSISLLFLSLCLFFFEFRRRKSEAHG